MNWRFLFCSLMNSLNWVFLLSFLCENGHIYAKHTKLTPLLLITEPYNFYQIPISCWTYLGYDMCQISRKSNWGIVTWTSTLNSVVWHTQEPFKMFISLSINAIGDFTKRSIRKLFYFYMRTFERFLFFFAISQLPLLRFIPPPTCGISKL